MNDPYGFVRIRLLVYGRDDGRPETKANFRKDRAKIRMARRREQAPALRVSENFMIRACTEYRSQMWASGGTFVKVPPFCLHFGKLMI